MDQHPTSRRGALTGMAGIAAASAAMGAVAVPKVSAAASG
jgi:hypothetical protein